MFAVALCPSETDIYGTVWPQSAPNAVAQENCRANEQGKVIINNVYT